MERQALLRRIEAMGPRECERLDRWLNSPVDTMLDANVGLSLTDGCQTKRPSHESLSLDNIDDVMKYQPWDREQLAAGDVVREALTAAAKAILRAVPSCRARDKALEQIVGARMDANAALSFRGRF